jgi:ATP-dependent RNA helicase HelY
VIIHLPSDCSIVSLSATVSNLEEFAGWLDQVRGNCRVILTEKRPVPLKQLVALRDDSKKGKDGAAVLYSLYNDGVQTGVEGLAAPPAGLDEASANLSSLSSPASLSNSSALTLNSKLVQKMRRLSGVDGRGNGEIRRRVRNIRSKRGQDRSYPGMRGAKGAGVARNRRKIPRRTAVICELARNNMLPCIYFIFSRQGCSGAVDMLSEASLRFTNEYERAQIADYIDSEIAPRIDRGDYQILDFHKWRNSLLNGYAAHHAGIVPVFKEAIEYLFEKGWVKVVFATETLALGVNMPARCVVIEKLTKFNGISHAKLQPGQYTQLTGRAGRRGMDTVGYAVVVDDRDLVPQDIAALASTRVYPLISSFMPSFNMAANLVDSVDLPSAKEVLSKSFAQYQIQQKNNELQERLDKYILTLENHKKRMENKNGQVSKQYRHQHNRLKAKKDQVIQEISKNSLLIIDRYERILQMLHHFDYIRPANKAKSDYNLSEKGEKLKNFYCEFELVFVESLMRGTLDKLSAPELSALLSCFISLSRNSEKKVLHPNDVPGGKNSRLAHALDDVNSVYQEMSLQAKKLGISLTESNSTLNFALIEPIYSYANGVSLGAIFDNENTGNDRRSISVGDFVRCSKGVIDILTQMTRYCDDHLATTALDGIDMLKRGIVSLYME